MKTKGLRQSRNIIDLRDKPVGPKKNLVRTKAYKKANAIGKLDEKTLSNSPVTDTRSLKNIDNDVGTKGSNRFVNIKRIVSGKSVGQVVKNRDLNSKPTTFKKDTKKK